MATKKEKQAQEKKYSFVLNHIKEYAKAKQYVFMAYNHPKMICLSDGQQIVRIDEYLQVEGHVQLSGEIAGQAYNACREYDH